jgi:hypothetical protein
MESLRHQLLQAELTRIEQDGEAKSISIMNRIDTLVAATLLCAKINEGIENITRFDPLVNFGVDTSCGIFIHTGDDGAVFMRRVREIGLGWEDVRASFKDTRVINIDGAPGVDVIVSAKHLSSVFYAAA